MKFSKGDLTTINGAITALLNDKNVKSKKLIYTLVKNSKILSTEVEAIQKAFDTNSEGYTEFTTKLREVYFKYGEVDEGTGNLKTAGNGIVLKDENDKPKIEKEVAALEKKYKDAIAEREAEVEAYKEFLKEEIDIPVIEIKFEDLPDEVGSDVMFVLDELITAPSED
jgi:hypothetical protein